ncbi:MAG: hypothetical protein ACHP65_03375 [Legionellales bacterium]
MITTNYFCKLQILMGSWGVSLGYFPDTDSVCNGVSMAWLSSCFTGNEEQFYQRISRIENSAPTLLQQKELQRTLQQRIPGTTPLPLTEEEEDMFQIFAFFEQIRLYQQPWQLHELFQNTYNQYDMVPVFQFASSKNLEDKGGLISIGSEDAVYSCAELAAYLKVE